jgi:hypothetical protein
MQIENQIHIQHNIELRLNEGYSSSIDTCVVILATANYKFIDVENKYIDCWWGKCNWKKVQQSLITHNDKIYDKIVIDVSGATIEYYFDITECF